MKTKSVKTFALLLIIPVVIVLALPYLQSGNGFQFYSVGDAFTLSVAPNRVISCTVADNLYVKFTGQSPQLASTASGGTFNPMIYYDLVQRNTRQAIESLPEKFVFNCDISKLQGTSVYMEGSLLIDIQASDSKGIYHRLTERTVTIPKQPVLSKTNMNIASYTISQKEINDALDVGNGDYTSWVIIDTAPYIKFTIPDALSTSSYSGVDLQTAYLARVVNNVPVQQISTQGTQNNIQDFNPKTFALPFAANQGFMTITGQEDHWVSAEGMPWVQFIDPTGYKYPKVKFSSYSNTDNDAWTEFKLTIQLPQNAKSGTWQLTMGSDQPQRSQISQRTFAVAAAPNIPNTSGSGNPISVSTNSTGSGVTGKIFFNYKENFNGETKSGAAPSPTYDINLKALDLTTAGRTGDVALSDIFVETILQLTDSKYATMNIADSQIVTSVSVSANGKTFLFNQLEITPTVVNSKDSNNNYHFQSVGVTANQIEQKLTENGVSPPDSKIPIYVTVESHGTFTLKDGSGKSFQGQMQGAAITFNLDYVKPSGLNGSQQDQGKCSITNLSACLYQKNDTSTSGGNPQQCTDSNGNVIQCPSNSNSNSGGSSSSSSNNSGGSSSSVGGNPNTNPSGSSGISGLCPNGLTDPIACGQYLASQLPTNVPNENLFVVVFAFLIVVLIIVAIVKRNRN